MVTLKMLKARRTRASIPGHTWEISPRAGHLLPFRPAPSTQLLIQSLRKASPDSNCASIRIDDIADDIAARGTGRLPDILPS